MTRYPKGLKEWVQQHYLEYDNDALAEEITKRFGHPASRSTVNSMKTRWGLSGAPRVKFYDKNWPKEVCDFIKANYIGIGHQAMADLVNKELGTSYTKEQIKGFYARNHLNSGLTGYFKRGQEPFNKGMKMSPEQYERCKATMIKPGNRPYNYVPIGTEIIDGDGYHKRKIADPNKWAFIHRLVWEEHNGTIPEGMLVSFKDGNKDNLNIENLVLLTKAENSYLNHAHLRSENPKITEAAVQVAKIQMKIKELKGNAAGCSSI